MYYKYKNRERETFAYVRVSSKEQNEDRQMLALRGWEIAEQNIYVDKKSGKDFERPAYKRMIRRLQKGDRLIVKSIDRLGRNYVEILEQWRIITKERGADITVLDMPLLDTARDKDLLGTLIGDLVLQLLSFVAQNERDNIRQRQAEGIAAAKARGVKFGRPEKNLPDNFDELYDKWRQGEISTEELSESCGMAMSVIYKKSRKLRAQLPQ